MSSVVMQGRSCGLHCPPSTFSRKPWFFSSLRLNTIDLAWQRYSLPNPKCSWRAASISTARVSGGRKMWSSPVVRPRASRSFCRTFSRCAVASLGAACTRSLPVRSPCEVARSCSGAAPSSMGSGSANGRVGPDELAAELSGSFLRLRNLGLFCVGPAAGGEVTGSELGTWSGGFTVASPSAGSCSIASSKASASAASLSRCSKRRSRSSCMRARDSRVASSLAFFASCARRRALSCRCISFKASNSFFSCSAS
mmetsp:Transcript_43285/g.134618  ORF Transcript_43285/g.134618 Transcript_43285/m.134618 type:complete len:254 (+) Transcript_43285:362-1123(+)